MSCPYCGKDDFYTREVTNREEEFDCYDENDDAVYKTVWTSYYEHSCNRCWKTWTTDWQTWSTEDGW